jgi:hypothetical protein
VRSSGATLASSRQKLSRFFTTVFACIVIFGVVAAVLDRLFVG